MTTTKLSALSNVMGEGTMERLIWAAWRAFWVGLGASAVIVGQSLLAPVPPAAEIAPPAIEQHDSTPSKSTFEAPRVSTVKARPRRQG